VPIILAGTKNDLKPQGGREKGSRPDDPEQPGSLPAPPPPPPLPYDLPKALLRNLTPEALSSAVNQPAAYNYVKTEEAKVGGRKEALGQRVTIRKKCDTVISIRVMVHLHVSDSAYEFPYDSMHDLHTKGIGFRLSFRHQLQLLVNTFQKK
jgi:hypothetical protein